MTDGAALGSWLPVTLVAVVMAAPPAWAQAPPVATAPPAGSPPPAVLGVSNPQRAWQNWTLNCQGCHRQDGTGSDATAPSLAGVVAKFLAVPGGREYLGRVPGVATSSLSDTDLAELMNWMFRRFDAAHLPVDFRPYTPEEIGTLRSRPLHLEAARMRTELLRKAEENAAPPQQAPSGSAAH